MNKLKDFLSGLSDQELAIFFEYRYHTFLENSKKMIDGEIASRNLSSEQLSLLKDRKLNCELSKEIRCCQRCGSDKLFVETDYTEMPVSEVASAEIATDSYRCRLCGYNADKSTSTNFTNRIKRVFGRNWRVSKWNEL